jgi:hypothetical protein
MPRSLLPVVAAADNFPYLASSSSQQAGLEAYVPFHLTATDCTNDFCPVGALRPAVYEAIASSSSSSESSDKPFRTIVSSSEQQGGDGGRKAICFADWVVEQGKMGEVMNDLATTWRKEGKFPGPLAGTYISTTVQSGGMLLRCRLAKRALYDIRRSSFINRQVQRQGDHATSLE